MVPLSGTFYRIVFEKYLDSALNGVLSPEGRNDDARVLCKLTVTGAQVCDIRPPNHTPTLH
ncbi:MAG: hypothetical protein EBU18_04080 [Rhodobacteraceae bacterium]|nr:hypothetical protein [Paracoccaceae bacterium]